MGLVHCPWHSDNTPSLNVSVKNDTLLVHCQAGCSQENVLQALRENDLWPQVNDPIPLRRAPKTPEHMGKQVAQYEYKDATGKVIAEKGRWENGEHKTFRWRKPGGTWDEGINPMKVEDIPLWGADLVAQAPKDETVWFCEGEKAVEACRARGLLAVTFGGGASSKSFGRSLEILVGHRVRIWPDNDEVGRTYAACVIGVLRTLGVKWSTVSVAVPEKGDAADYFASGGTVQAIDAQVLDVPVVEHLASDSIRVKMMTVLGLIQVTASDITKSSRSLDMVFKLEVKGPPERDVITVRLNAHSMSQITELRRTLDDLHKDGDWRNVLNKTVGLIEEGFLSHDPSEDVADIEVQECQTFHVEKLAPLAEPTIFFGDGGSLKSYVAFGVAIHSAVNGEFLGLPAVRGRWLVVDYETNKNNFAWRISRIARGMGLTSVPPGVLDYWPAVGPFPDIADSVAAKVRRMGHVGIIVDSAGAACGGEPENAEIALRYFRALASIGVTSITIAHMAKGSDGQRPFGSAFWHNAARRTWYVEKPDREESDIMDMGLYCRKVNDGPKPRPMGVEVRFDGERGPVTFHGHDIRSNPDLDAKRPLDTRVWDALSNPHTVYELADELDEQESTIKKCLENHKDRFARSEDGNKGGAGKVTTWGRRVQDNWEI